MRSGRLRLLKWLAVATSVSLAALTLSIPTVAASTGTIAVCATDSTGANIVLGSDKAWYEIGSTSYYVGAVGSSGCRESTLNAGTQVEVWVAKSGTTSQHLTGTVPDGSTLRFDFYTTKVTLAYPHDIAFGGPNGDYGWFKQTAATASQELFSDGVTQVHFRLSGVPGYARTSLSWPIATGPGATFDRTLYVARLLDHKGTGLAGGTVDYYLGGWNADVGQTDTNGNYVLALSGDSSYLSVAMHYGGTRNQQSRSQAVNSIFTFQTTLVRVAIQSHTNDYLDIPNDGSASYYAGGWHTITTKDPNDGRLVQAEMLPGTYSFAATYNGTRDQKELPISGSVVGVYFHAALVSIQLLDHKGNALDLPANGSGSYYAGGWHSMTTKDTTGNEVQAEMLPGVYSFAATYNGTREQLKYTVIEPNPNNHDDALQTVVFQTTLEVVELQPPSGPFLNILANGSASYYANGWHSITTPNPNNHAMVVAEMLPGSYSFAVTYLGTRDQKSATIGTGPTQAVYFHTGTVHSASGTATSYYAGGWRTFTSGMELLPGKYTFAFDGGPNAVETITAGTVNTIP